MDEEQRAVILAAVMREYPEHWSAFLPLPDDDPVALCAFRCYALVMPALVEAGRVAMDALRTVRAEVRRREDHQKRNRRPIGDGASGRGS